MAQPILKCSKCGREMIRDYGGKQKLRTNILIFEDGKCIAKCMKCKANVEVPIILDMPLETGPAKNKVKYVVRSLDKR